MVYSYEYTLHNRAIVVTFDLSARGLSLFDTDHWLSNEKNIIVLRLTQSAWEGGAAAVPHIPVPPREEMQGWTVNDMVRWLESADLSGPAEKFRLNGVSGADFLGFSSAAALEQDLRVTPFCARKLIDVRERFLNA